MEIDLVHTLDFSRSFVTFFTTAEQGRNVARIQIDAACEIEGWGLPEPVRYYLIAPCRAEHMYRDGPLFQMPNYEFCGIFSDGDLVLIRTRWTSDEERPEYALPTERFQRVAIDTTPMPAEALTSDEAVVAAVLANRRLVARTTLRDAGGTVTARLEYPIKTMNVTEEPARFQVDTGPLIVPHFDSTEEQVILRFAMAHVVYWDRTRAEFILRRPHVVGEAAGTAVRVTDYAEPLFTAADNELWAELPVPAP
jgi:hypothetical protein